MQQAWNKHTKSIRITSSVYRFHWYGESRSVLYFVDRARVLISLGRAFPPRVRLRLQCRFTADSVAHSSAKAKFRYLPNRRSWMQGPWMPGVERLKDSKYRPAGQRR